MPVFKFKNETEWLEARSKDLTSTEIAALLGVTEYKTRFKLWQEKSGMIESDFEDNLYTKWGRRLQQAIAIGFAEDNCFDKLEDLSLTYARHPILQLGSSFDYAFSFSNGARGLLEIKTTSYFTEELGWEKEDAPIQYEIQLQTQLHLAKTNGIDFECGVIGALDGRKNARIYTRKYDQALGELIEQETAKFWDSVRSGIPPEPDYIADDELLSKLRKSPRKGEKKNLTANSTAAALIALWKELDDKIKLNNLTNKPLEEQKKAIKNRLFEIIGDAETVTIGQYQITTKEQVLEDTFRAGGKVRRFDVKTLKKGN